VTHRIYSIQDKASGELVGLVRAASKNGAVRFMAEQQYEVKTAEQEALVWGIQNGIAVQDATAEAKPDESGEPQGE
jgi:hypothetical protein